MVGVFYWFLLLYKLFCWLEKLDKNVRSRRVKISQKYENVPGICTPQRKGTMILSSLFYTYIYITYYCLHIHDCSPGSFYVQYR